MELTFTFFTLQRFGSSPSPNFKNPYIFATQCRKLLLFSIVNSVRLNNINLQNTVCKDIETLSLGQKVFRLVQLLRRIFEIFVFHFSILVIKFINTNKDQNKYCIFLELINLYWLNLIKRMFNFYLFTVLNLTARSWSVISVYPRWRTVVSWQQHVEHQEPV